MIPDLSAYDTSAPAAYEWLLSDHPWAVTERARQHAAAAGHDFALMERIRQFTEHVDRTYPGEPDEATQIRIQATLAELTLPIEANGVLLDVLDPGADDMVEAARARWQTQRRDAGDNGYRYPQRLLGAAAEAVPPPGFTTVATRRGRIADPLEDLHDAERARIAFITAAIPVLVDDAVVLEVGGYAPVQVIGTYGGKSWYHRHRDGMAELSIGADPLDDPEEYVETDADDPAMFTGGALTTVRVIGELFATLHPPAYLC
jgi:hypothetical protein